MNTVLSSITTFASILALVTAAGAEPDTHQTHVLELLSSATSMNCDASHSFAQRLLVCEAGECRKVDVTDQHRVRIATGDRAELTLVSSVTTSEGDVILGDSDSRSLDTTRSLQFSQTVVGKAGCMKSLYYRFGPRR
jgi:hypothetical protein